MKERLQSFNSKNHSDVSIEEFSKNWELIALQGPKSHEVLSKFLSTSVDLSKLPFMFQINAEVAGINCIVTRCGYTGEDGFEIAVPANQVKKLWNELLSNSSVKPAGLGVRDSLRLEAGLCLYGHDLNESITPIEAQLAWLISKRRREQGGFLGFETISNQLKNGVSKKRVGIDVLTKAPAREGVEIFSADGSKAVGTITSGTFSPVLNRPISMGYVATEQAKEGTKLQLKVRGKMQDAQVTKLPFVPNKFYKIPTVVP
jgi:aminomethyltransferase